MHNLAVLGSQSIVIQWIAQVIFKMHSDTIHYKKHMTSDYSLLCLFYFLLFIWLFLNFIFYWFWLNFSFLYCKRFWILYKKCYINWLLLLLLWFQITCNYVTLAFLSIEHHCFNSLISSFMSIFVDSISKFFKVFCSCAGFIWAFTLPIVCQNKAN